MAILAVDLRLRVTAFDWEHCRRDQNHTGALRMKYQYVAGAAVVVVGDDSDVRRHVAVELPVVAVVLATQDKSLSYHPLSIQYLQPAPLK